jgi:hypothetical protein
MLITRGYGTCTTSGVGTIGGTIELEPGWQLITTPVEFGYWDITSHRHIHDVSTLARFENYIMVQIDDLYGPGNIEVANTFTGDSQSYYSYIPGSTPSNSPHNFFMVYNDGSNKEYTGYWIKSVNINNMIISWGES